MFFPFCRTPVASYTSPTVRSRLCAGAAWKSPTSLEHPACLRLSRFAGTRNSPKRAASVILCRRRFTSSPVRSATPCEDASRQRAAARSEEHTSELQSLAYLVCRLLLEKKKSSCPYTLLSYEQGVHWTALL